MGFFTEGSVIMNILSKSDPLKLKHLNDGFFFFFTNKQLLASVAIN